MHSPMYRCRMRFCLKEENDFYYSGHKLQGMRKKRMKHPCKKWEKGLPFLAMLLSESHTKYHLKKECNAIFINLIPKVLQSQWSDFLPICLTGYMTICTEFSP